MDLFCGAGGAAKGYQRAGFYVVGVDINAQPNYCGDEFVQMDALETLGHFAGFWDVAAIHASPPCQAYSDLQNQNKREYPDLIGPVRELLRATGLPYVIENVPEAPLDSPIVLCGTMFPGLRVIRHRGFEANFPLEAVTQAENNRRFIPTRKPAKEQTRCKRGHDLTNPENVYVKRDGRRQCRICTLDRQREKWPERAVRRRASRTATEGPDDA